MGRSVGQRQIGVPLFKVTQHRFCCAYSVPSSMQPHRECAEGKVLWEEIGWLWSAVFGSCKVLWLIHTAQLWSQHNTAEGFVNTKCLMALQLWQGRLPRRNQGRKWMGNVPCLGHHSDYLKVLPNWVASKERLKVFPSGMKYYSQWHLVLY